MHTHRSPLRIAVLAAAAAFASVAAAPALAEVPATAQIYLQRDSDGHVMLTDRPSPTALTQRTWQMERENPAAAQQRALDVRREAQIVSERIARQLEVQQRLAANDDAMRMRMARYNPTALDDDDDDIVGVPFLRPIGRAHRAVGVPHRPPSQRPMTAARTGARFPL